MSVGKPPTPVGYADPGVVAHADPVADDRADSVAYDRAAFVANGRVDPVADGRADSGTDGGADPGVVARAESTRRMSVGKPPTPVGCADQTTNCVLSASSLWLAHHCLGVPAPNDTGIFLPLRPSRLRRHTSWPSCCSRSRPSPEQPCGWRATPALSCRSHPRGCVDKLPDLLLLALPFFARAT